MDFGHCCFFYIAAASATLPLFTFGRLSFTILLAPFLRFAAPCPCVFVRLLRSLLLVQALLVPLFLSVSPCSDAFCAALYLLLLLHSILRAPFVTQQVPLPLTSLRLRHILVLPFYVFTLFLAKERKRKREFLHFNRKNYSFHGIFLSNIFGSLAKKLYFCSDCCREITCLVKSSLVFVLVNGSTVASETPINSFISIVYVFIRNMNFLSFPFGSL